jgi:hypothetical protein
MNRPAWNTNSPHKYGVMTVGESNFMDKLIDTIHAEFGSIQFLEIGVAQGATMAGVMERCQKVGCKIHYEGVDLPMGKPEFSSPDCVFHPGDSAEIFNDVSGKFNLLFVDGCHCINHCMLDFLHYSQLVVEGGYCLFHDTRDTHWQGEHYQGHGPHIPEFMIGVRSGLRKLGLLNGKRTDWTLVEEVADTDIMGMILFKKLHD